MIIHKDMIDLLGYGVNFGDLSIIPVRIDADNEKCEIEFKTMNKQYLERTLIRKGNHNDFIFSTSINDVPFTIDLRTGLIKKIRIRETK